MHYFLQHLNDLSGSPLILRQRLDKTPCEISVTLITNYTIGFLTGWPGKFVKFNYVKHESHILRFISLSVWYINVIWYLVKNLKPGDGVTASTIISSPALICAFIYRNVTFELMVNEIYFRVPIWNKIGLMCAKSPRVYKTYLSKFVKSMWAFGGPNIVVYPKLRKELIEMSNSINTFSKNRNCLRFFLVGSMIEAKGYRLFVEIARYYERNSSNHRFHLYLSGDQSRFYEIYPMDTLPNNLIVDFNNVSPKIFFDKDVFLGLTNTKLWIETFGQTFAEAMLAGNIVVVPHIGAHLEYIRDGETGFVFHRYAVAEVIEQIERIICRGDLDLLGIAARRSIIEFYKNNEAIEYLTFSK